MSELTTVVKERRSANNFLENQPISINELNEMFELTKFAPSANNLQHAKYIAVLDTHIKEQIKEAAGQYKVSTASAVILVLGDKKAHQNVAQIYEGLLHLGIMDQREYEETVSSIITDTETKGEKFQSEEAIRNASLSAMQFMLIAKDKGWDTCPMIGFDQAKVREILNITNQYEITLMITIGKEKTASRRPRGYRKPVMEFVTYI
ncbi:nitroreductase family protein [Peribacillus asahii]|uniref:nitroreductase family protein n=1 Tax=Peribacillus asahii TaxID=228899 RepID=UPI0037FA1FC9